MTINKADRERILKGLYLLGGMEECEAHRIEVHLNWPNMDRPKLRVNKWSQAARRRAIKIRALIVAIETGRLSLEPSARTSSKLTLKTIASGTTIAGPEVSGATKRTGR